MWNNKKYYYLPDIRNVLFIYCCIYAQVESIQSARLMRFLIGPPIPKFTQNRRLGTGPVQKEHVLAGVDKLHQPSSGIWRPPLIPPGFEGTLIRREYTGNWPYGVPNQTSRFAHNKDATAVLDVGKNQIYRLKEGQQNNYQTTQYIQNFKTSPNLNENVAVKNNVLGRFSVHSPVQQFAIPVEASKFITTYQKSEGQNTYPASKRNNQQLHQLSNIKAQNNYVVYEDPESVVKNFPNFDFNYRQPAERTFPQKSSNEAENYLHFMSTNEYFLPKRDPNYKQLDIDRDQVTYQKQRIQEKSQQKPVQTIVERQQTDNRFASSLNKPLHVADLFYQPDPAPTNSAVVRSSYQTSQNAFIVKSDGNKSIKHILSISLDTKRSAAPSPGSAPAPLQSPVWYSAPNTESPEPLRFEFTEHDAIKGTASYTNAPQGEKFYYETQTSIPHIPTTSTSSMSQQQKPIQNSLDGLKDITEYADMRPQEQPVSEPVTKPMESKESEAYCEQICANVYDENDEIICGSDGYMYTGETQLQCYSSCLNIEVSIKSKGSCA